MRIAISAGHNPDKAGATYKVDGKVILREHDEALHWVRLVKAALQARGYETFVVPPRHLRNKVADINAEGDIDVAIEIHFNAAINSHGENVGRGSETLYCPKSDAGEFLALEIQDYLGKVFLPSRGVKPGWYRMDKPGQVDYEGDVDGDEVADYFLRKTAMPAVIIEPEFIHRWHLIHDLRHEGADAIADGLDRWARSRET